LVSDWSSDVCSSDLTHQRAGTPRELVRRQLGHSTPVLTLKTYGAIIPSGDDRAKWEGVVAADQARRREAGNLKWTK